MSSSALSAKREMHFSTGMRKPATTARLSARFGRERPRFQRQVARNRQRITTQRRQCLILEPRRGIQLARYFDIY